MDIYIVWELYQRYLTRMSSYPCFRSQSKDLQLIIDKVGDTWTVQSNLLEKYLKKCKIKSVGDIV